jgi:hypothetical protein
MSLEFLDSDMSLDVKIQEAYHTICFPRVFAYRMAKDIYWLSLHPNKKYLVYLNMLKCVSEGNCRVSLLEEAQQYLPKPCAQYRASWGLIMSGNRDPRVAMTMSSECHYALYDLKERQINVLKDIYEYYTLPFLDPSPAAWSD